MRGRMSFAVRSIVGGVRKSKVVVVFAVVVGRVDDVHPAEVADAVVGLVVLLVAAPLAVPGLRLEGRHRWEERAELGGGDRLTGLLGLVVAAEPAPEPLARLIETRAPGGVRGDLVRGGAPADEANGRRGVGLGGGLQPVEQTEHQPVRIGDLAADDLAIAPDRLARAVKRAVQRDVVEFVPADGDRVRPSLVERLGTVALAQAVRRGWRAADGVGRLGDAAGLGQHVEEAALDVGAPAVLAGTNGHGLGFVDHAR